MTGEATFCTYCQKAFPSDAFDADSGEHLNQKSRHLMTGPRIIDAGRDPPFIPKKSDDDERD